MILNLNIILVSYIIPNVWLEPTGKAGRTQKLGGPSWLLQNVMNVVSGSFVQLPQGSTRRNVLSSEIPNPMEQHTDHTARDLMRSLRLGRNIKWNFAKFLVDRQGQPVARYGPQTSPLSFEEEIVKLL